MVSSTHSTLSSTDLHADRMTVQDDPGFPASAVLFEIPAWEAMLKVSDSDRPIDPDQARRWRHTGNLCLGYRGEWAAGLSVWGVLASCAVCRTGRRGDQSLSADAKVASHVERWDSPSTDAFDDGFGRHLQPGCRLFY
jgi:hypothetical protein